MAVIDYKSLKIGSTFLVSGQIIQAIIAFGVNLVLVRIIAPDEFGRFALVLAGASVVYTVISPRINILIIRMSDSDYDDRIRDLYFSAMTFETLAATAFIFFWLGVTGNAGSWEAVLVCAVGLRHWTDLNKSFFERTMPYRALAIMETGASMGGHLLALAMALSGFGWIVLFVREAVISVISVLGLWRLGGLTIRRLRFLSTAEWMALYKDARGIWLDGVLEGSFQRLTILLAGLIGGETTAGLFFQAQRLAFVPNQFLSPLIHRVLANWFGRTEDTNARREGRDRILLYLCAPLLMAGALTIAFADPVVPWLFGENWARVGDIMVAMCGVVSFFSLFETLKIYCLSTRRSVILLGGRMAQYAGLLILAVAGFFGWISADIALATGLSVAYFLAFALIFILLRSSERKAGK